MRQDLLTEHRGAGGRREVLFLALPDFTGHDRLANGAPNGSGRNASVTRTLNLPLTLSAEACNHKKDGPNVGVKRQITAQRLFVRLNELLGH